MRRLNGSKNLSTAWCSERNAGNIKCSYDYKHTHTAADTPVHICQLKRHSRWWKTVQDSCGTCLCVAQNRRSRRLKKHRPSRRCVYTSRWPAPVSQAEGANSVEFCTRYVAKAVAGMKECDDGHKDVQPEQCLENLGYGCKA